ncbi:MAG: hypothetical protein MJE77_24100 [Proteobacteria bacterium]|nr:hypothetical protein [Pseudomonadota bacterium]
MSAVFPFDLPFATAMYVALYLATLVIHVAFMSYVLAGTGYVAAMVLFGRGKGDPVAHILRDWLPFALGGAITAGVAPLLFLQILYKESFYTANLLLFHRWMAMIPVLMIGFYALYLAKSKAIEGWPWHARSAVSLVAFACFAITAYSWTENHLLGLDRGEWVQFYGSGHSAYVRGSVFARAGMWIAGAIPIMAVIAGWQLRRVGVDSDSDRSSLRRLALLAIAGSIGAVGLGLAYAIAVEQPKRIFALDSMAWPYLVIIALAMAVQVVAWGWQWRIQQLDRRALTAISLALLGAVFATAILREALRIASLDAEELFRLHQRAAGAGGVSMFALFATINSAIIVSCLLMVRRGLRSKPQNQE